MTGRMVQAFMKGLHGPHPRYQRATSGCKALSVYSGPESSRFSFDAKATERDLRMTYFPAFKMCVEANANSIMCSYSRCVFICLASTDLSANLRCLAS